eukprot:419247_1
MPLGDEDETALFFWFVESQRNPKEDPIALWNNGGPGASSIADGFWIEHGPFRLQDNAAGVNDYNWSWNKIASIIYLESPSGVGFSYSNKTSGYNCSDEKSAKMNYLFLVNFFNVFTSYVNNDFYLTGESYAGHYTPQLAQYIMENGKLNKWKIKGFLIGNPAINSDWYYNTNEYAFQTYLWSHGLLPQTAYIKSRNACDWNQFLTNCSADFTHPNQACSAANQAAYKYIPNTWDPYDIYAPTCHNRESDKYWNKQFIEEHTPWLIYLKEKYNINTTYVYNPCMSSWTSEYMNGNDVLKAIHADSHYTKKWPSKPSGWHYGSERADIALLFPNFFQNEPNWRISVVSGDADSAVPFVGTQRWIECLGRSVVKQMQDWYLNQDVAGVVKIYDGITFQTVKHCGHTIPTYCPQPGFQFFKDYIDGTYSS